jgi:hypothetical protein
MMFTNEVQQKLKKQVDKYQKSVQNLHHATSAAGLSDILKCFDANEAQFDAIAMSLNGITAVVGNVDAGVQALVERSDNEERKALNENRQKICSYHSCSHPSTIHD